ncbi:MAG: YbaB/EbfC family nucleoid-associated protein [Mollicutes bacterium]|nr:YbaB/EbfC family nucleoid-associated protein [bacterium]MDD6801478.1 YbaB/EbfC family nucleoid-associated protein [Mollicutes bacterium]MDD7064940.1 YbaB/EbfC family nucleoid-associated protein [Mollicutes bacterium]MDY2687872.1 YbaB/EbfC family nucleoid-associated protein [Candidatus Enteromonas sp.]MDY5298847.1 YbaB/EbfC family nucleoid-associated protein [Candidatus Enteromonas sp.]
MNQMQQMIMQAQRMQREMKKAQDALEQKEFVVEKGGMVKMTVLGNRSVKSVEIDKDALDPENADLLCETIAMAVNEAMEEIQKESDAIQEKITGQSGMPF